jgi:hypothetical protein
MRALPVNILRSRPKYGDLAKKDRGRKIEERKGKMS